MDRFINRLVDRAGDMVAERPGLLPSIGASLILLNLLLQVFVSQGIWLVESNLLLHVGLIVAIVGLLLIRPLS